MSDKEISKFLFEEAEKRLSPLTEVTTEYYSQIYRTVINTSGLFLGGWITLFSTGVIKIVTPWVVFSITLHVLTVVSASYLGFTLVLQSRRLLRGLGTFLLWASNYNFSAKFDLPDLEKIKENFVDAQQSFTSIWKDSVAKDKVIINLGVIVFCLYVVSIICSTVVVFISMQQAGWINHH